MVGQMGHCCKKDFKSHKFSVINVFNKHADIIFSSCHYDDDEEEKPLFSSLHSNLLERIQYFDC